MKKKEVEELAKSHQWYCVLAMENSISGESGSSPFNWQQFATAAYHAGAARSLQRVLFDWPEKQP